MIKVVRYPVESVCVLSVVYILDILKCIIDMAVYLDLGGSKSTTAATTSEGPAAMYRALRSISC